MGWLFLVKLFATKGWKTKTSFVKVGEEGKRPLELKRQLQENNQLWLRHSQSILRKR